MLYPKSKSDNIDKALFQNPTSEYRGAPLWAWNCELSEKLLRRQIGYLHEMGFGSFHMHSRIGLSSPYLGDDFMSNINICADEAQKRDMKAMLYDEDKWPSGYAGGYVTKNPKYRQRFVVFTSDNDYIPELFSFEEAIEKGAPYYICTYDIVLNHNGTLSSYRIIDRDEKAVGIKRIAYCDAAKESGSYNGYTYADLLNKEAVEQFIHITYDAYKKATASKFGTVIPTIFTDEPQYAYKEALPYANSTCPVKLPWTPGMRGLFEQYTGLDIIEKLPELFFDLPNGEVSRFRYLYHDFVAELFASCYADNCGKWCEENGILLTGHLVEEPTLYTQTAATGEVMRCYRSFHIPGVDLLCNTYEYTTLKQAQSSAHQYGREGVMSELYGVTNWDFDMRGHKTQGDWQAALGVTLRVPHLSMVSMAGESKRDYPASLNYQLPWYKEYKYIENHFARLNTALTRGVPCVKVAVIHPVESYWLHWGPMQNTSDIRNDIDEKFQNLIQWLLFGTIDFDYVSESSLTGIFGGCADGKFNVGKMAYSAVVVAGVQTLRRTTLNALREFSEAGGKVVFAGSCPSYVDALPSDEAMPLYERSVCVPFEKLAILDALESEREIEIRDKKGVRYPELIYNMRIDGRCRWLFIARGRTNYGIRDPYSIAAPNAKSVPLKDDVYISIKGHYIPEVYDTLTGEVEDIEYEYTSDSTVVHYGFWGEGSLLLRLESGKSACSYHRRKKSVIDKIVLRGRHSYTLEEPNVLLLDRAEFSLNDSCFEPEEEILRLDAICRDRVGIVRKDTMPQPWVFDDEDMGHTLMLRFTINSEIDIDGAKLGIEDAEKHEFTFNGEPLTPVIDGFFADEAIKTFKLPPIRKGKNVLTVKMKLTIRSNTEWCYILGDFGVKVEGSEATIVKLPSHIGYSPLKMQGLPFYSGNIIYQNEIETPDCDLKIQAPNYVGGALKVFVDGTDCGNISLAPNECEVKNVKAGKHIVEFKLFGNRYNSFGTIHNTNAAEFWYGPNAWRTQDLAFSYEYQLKEMGVLAAPVITVCSL